MCGINGIVCKYGKKEENLEIIKNMNNRIIHRGPNAEGVFACDKVALGHRRLSIIDLEGGNQPIYNEDGKIMIVFNGEIYNYKELKKQLTNHEFKTNTDTEVLIHAYEEWGLDFLTKLRGMFAFAIYDKNDNCVILARDHFGVKPLFYTNINNTFIFASEIKALFQYPGVEKSLDTQGISELFGIGPAHTPGTTIFKDIYEIKPAHFAIFNESGLHIKRYWKLKSKKHLDSFEETCDKLKFLLNDSITRQLVSDMPLCTFLSGGLDSSIITKFASDYCKDNGLAPLDTYSIDYVDNDKNFVKYRSKLASIIFVTIDCISSLA